jgi:hypothetical protein
MQSYWLGRTAGWSNGQDDEAVSPNECEVLGGLSPTPQTSKRILHVSRASRNQGVFVHRIAALLDTSLSRLLGTRRSCVP